MRPILDEATPLGVDQTLELGLVVAAEPGEQRQIVAAFEHVHRIELQQPEPVEARIELADADARWSRAAEALGGEADASGLCC